MRRAASGVPAYPFCRRAQGKTRNAYHCIIERFLEMQLVSKVLEMHDECIRNYQIVYQQIEIDTRQTLSDGDTRPRHDSSHSLLLKTNYLLSMAKR